MARPIFFPKSPYPHYYPCSENSNPKVIVEKEVFTALFSTEKTFPNSEVDKLIFFKQRIRSETSSRARKVSTTKLRKSKRFKRTPNFWYSSRTVPVITKGKEDDEHGERVCTQHMPKIGWSAAGVPARLHWRRTEEASPFNAKLPMQAATIQLLHHRRLTRIVEVRSSRITRRRSEWWTGAYPKAKPVAFVNQAITD